MRLLNSKTLELQSFVPSQVPDYVILSHRWGPQELLYDDIVQGLIQNQEDPTRNKAGLAKVQGACGQAARDGYEWIWIDSCCINKASSSELHEAINSMWNYYERSNICYVYMMDVPDSEAGWDERFTQSEWFNRGWTLQELLAPVSVEFYAGDWSYIGTKLERYEQISRITHIDPEMLVHTHTFDHFCVAERLSWAAHRQVTREEDEAYSLLGLFYVNMPLLYGEGREKAFVRLQEAIYLGLADDSIFLFNYTSHVDSLPLLADSPTRFCTRVDCIECTSKGTRCFASDIPYSSIVATPGWFTQAHEQIIAAVTPVRNEMSVSFSLLKYQLVKNQLKFFNKDERRLRISHVAVLNHTLLDHGDGSLCLLLYRSPKAGGVDFIRTRFFPALLPNVADYTSEIEKTKILVSPGPNNVEGNQRLEVSFSVQSASFSVLAWNVKRPGQRVRESVSTGPHLSINTTKAINTQTSLEVRIVDIEENNHASQLLLRLKQSAQAWSISEVFEVNIRKKPRKQDTIFQTATLADRCVVQLSDGRRFSIGLRRSAASARARNTDTLPHFKYHILVKALGEEVRKS